MSAPCARQRSRSDSSAWRASAEYPQTESVRSQEPPRALEKRHQRQILGRRAVSRSTLRVVRPRSFQSRGPPRRGDAQALPVRCAPLRRVPSARLSPAWVACVGYPTVLASSRQAPAWAQARRTVTIARPGIRWRQVSGLGGRTLYAMPVARIRLECRSRPSDRAIRESGTDTGRAAPRRRVRDADSPQAPPLSPSIAPASTAMYLCRLSRVSCMISRSLQW